MDSWKRGVGTCPARGRGLTGVFFRVMECGEKKRRKGRWFCGELESDLD